MLITRVFIVFTIDGTSRASGEANAINKLAISLVNDKKEIIKPGICNSDVSQNCVMPRPEIEIPP